MFREMTAPCSENQTKPIKAKDDYKCEQFLLINLRNRSHHL